MSRGSVNCHSELPTGTTKAAQRHGMKLLIVAAHGQAGVSDVTTRRNRKVHDVSQFFPVLIRHDYFAQAARSGQHITCIDFNVQLFAVPVRSDAEVSECHARPVSRHFTFRFGCMRGRFALAPDDSRILSRFCRRVSRKLPIASDIG